MTDIAVVYRTAARHGRGSLARRPQPRVAVPLRGSPCPGRNASAEPGAARLVRIPAIPPDAVFLQSERAVTFREADAVVEEEARLTGLLATWLRGHLEHGSEEQRRANMELVLSAGGPLHLKRVAVEGLEDPEAPLIVRMSYAAPGVLHEAGANRVTTLPLPWYHRLVAAARPAGVRHAPLAISRPLRLECRTTVHAPAGFAVPASKDLAAEERGELISTTRSARPLRDVPTGVVIEAGLTRTTARLPADRAADYAAETERAGRLLEPTLVFQPR